MDKHKQINESILLGYFTGTLSIPLQQEVDLCIRRKQKNSPGHTIYMPGN